ncbi:MAG TPA: YggS family pyridoxal phosphate-dependent enzyme [Luteolibacter sp.]|nr:YggS family pyridoxal phosphate-dependent enzyme [Luteolibacter sp.]
MSEADPSDTIATNLARVITRIADSCRRGGRDPSDVELIAVSKTFPAEAVREAAEAGQTLFGESRLQEAEPKMSLLPGSLRWHFIGRVQRNKVRRMLPLFETIHAVDSLRLAAYMDGVAADLGLFPKVFLQVNIGGEQTKGGFESDAILREAAEVFALPRLEVMGLMCIPPPGREAEDSRQWFVALRDLRDRVEQEHSTRLPCLSMGMSGDFEVAIEEGATHVRVGSSIFGERAYRVDGELG